MLGRKSSSPETGLLYQLLEMKINGNETCQSLNSTSGRGAKCTKDPKGSLVHSLPALSVPTHYSDISGHANSVIDLIFLGINCAQVTHCIEHGLRVV